ncbi:Rgg/GadR/MutR family transcriptional regulator [Leuconostoc citreum]|uniref:Rgg/GadR/MutR family transcriptional regulator n=1 Tax=Leuconostoc citreum TaxID=33964 RepID=UPI0011BBA20E|nr:Rgg/GadR/MutR family transcriptional regulator [Leuconostoc citreum]MBA5938471.1 helix-turn-helix domain-containing protein [Leuconostoc citreum]MBE4726668.1 helix-turn-helix domain-containing protein [Leuconostoc citreum]MCT3069150.1 Rgg/GadR/MutR family transcriptional regulator [Leuconostoc citreum]QEA36993.1 helix-turn-helix domain-containing protein [Leuconostoc citreum]
MNYKNGELIRKTRQKRGMSQAKLGALIGSQSMISRIENNQTDPSDQTVLMLCDALMITFEEYFYSIFDKKQSKLSALANQLEIIDHNNDGVMLDKLYVLTQSQSRSQPDSLLNRHLFLMTKATKYHLKKQLAPHAIQDELVDYFFDIENWQYYDILLFSRIVYMVPVNRLSPYIKDILNQYRQHELSTHSERTLKKVINNLLEASVVQNNYTFTQHLINQLKSMAILTDDLALQTWLLFWQGVILSDNTLIANAYQVTSILHQKSMLKRFNKFIP